MLKFPIAFKLILMTTVILLAVTVPIALRISQLVVAESSDREKENNRAQAAARGREIEVTLQNLVEKTNVFGTLLLQQSLSKDHTLYDISSKKSFAFQFQRDPETIAITIYEKAKDKTQAIAQKVNQKYLEEYNQKEKYLRKLNKKKPFPIGSVFGGKVELKNRSIRKKVPIISIGAPLVKDDLGRVTHIAVADFKLYSLQKGFATAGVRTTFLVDAKGVTLAHPNEKLALSGRKLSSLAIVKRALKSTATSGQMKYYHKKRKEKMVAAFSRTAFGLAVISEAPLSVILEPAENVKRNVYYVTGFVLCIALFVVFLFALSLTKPIERLVALTKRIAKGDFDLLARMVVKSKDEVGELAFAFDNMVTGLRERDKAKNILNKFHGSSVAEDLMAGEAAVGGIKKKVAVFFSDIRGFTAFSEKRAPEDVVKMLNEYFSHMVPKIYERNGVVDKFIGDAIMAIWGAPKSSGDDAYDALMASIGMRKALDKLNKDRLSRNEEPLNIGMGLHYGFAISGTIGSEDRLEYTVIGDAVNVAARIEASTKSFGADLLVSEDVYHDLKDRFLMSYQGSVEVKGKSEGLKLYSVRGYIEDGKEVIVETPYSSYKKGEDAKVKIKL